MAATISLNARTSSTIEVYISGLDSSYSNNDRNIAWYIDGTFDGTDSLKSGVSKSSVWKFTKLDPSTTYLIEATIFNTTQSVYVELDRNITTEDEETEVPSEDPIDNWYWSTSISKGVAVSKVSYKEWNSLISKIDELLDTGHYGSWLTKSSEGATLSMSASKMTSSDKKLTADRFNSVRYNIGAHRGTGISKVSSGDIVYADYFDSLETAINKWINEYNNDYT